MILADVKGRKMTIIQDNVITSGSVGMVIYFRFDNEWEGVQKTAVFTGSEVKISVLLENDQCVIPHENLTKYGGLLRIGVYGEGEDVVIPTIYCDIPIYQGAVMNYGTSEDATPGITKQLFDAIAKGDEDTIDQIMNVIGALDDLITIAKDNLVNAINEAAQSGGGGGGGGTSNYNLLGNKPQINGHELEGNSSLADIGVSSAITAALGTLNPLAVGIKMGTAIPDSSIISPGQIYLKYSEGG